MTEVLQVASELAQMVELYRAEQPKRVLEIGVWEGGTLREWLAGAPELVVVVDVEHRVAEQYDEWRANETELIVVEGSSQDAGVVEAIRSHGPYDWCFVDGDHGEWFAVADTALAMDVTAAGGLVLIHDIVDCYSEGPANAFAQFGMASGREAWAYVDAKREPWGHGIGVIRV